MGAISGSRKETSENGEQKLLQGKGRAGWWEETNKAVGSRLHRVEGLRNTGELKFCI